MGITSVIGHLIHCDVIESLLSGAHCSIKTKESSHNKTGASITGSTIEELSNREMDGPSFYCAYLGFSPISKPPTNLNALQNPVRDMYFKYRKIPTGSRSASLKLTQKGVFVSIYEDGAVKSEDLL
ncbi:hypothetical protein Btru_019406 [Bulinus truncatus]|nr:hypothetical protein Btru_019406 [Bulinus truncatus]